jgi:CRISPR-associated protein Cas5d
MLPFLNNRGVIAMPMPSIRVRVSGDFACFTRPETKVERFSYPVMTPSAARNILDAICWRPQMRWIVTSITVLKQIRMMSVLRNEVQHKATIESIASSDGKKEKKQSISLKAIRQWMDEPARFRPLIAGAGDGTDCTPRNTTLLRDVAYWIDAYPQIFDAGSDATGPNTTEKYVAMLNRRVEKGQCFQRPYLGCREFAADFGPPRENDRPEALTMEIGRMLYDIAFLPAGNQAAFFDARLINGVLDTDPSHVLHVVATRQRVLGCSYQPKRDLTPGVCREEVKPCLSNC